MSASKKNKKKNVESKRIKEITDKIEKFQEINVEPNKKVEQQEVEKNIITDETQNNENKKVIESQKIETSNKQEKLTEKKVKNKKKDKKIQQQEEIQKEDLKNSKINESVEISEEIKREKLKISDKKKESKSPNVKKSNDESEQENIEDTKAPEKQEQQKEDILTTTLKRKQGEPEYVKEMLENKKKKTLIFVCIIMLIVLIIGFSTVFAILNLNSIKIAKGVSIRGIDVSDLTIQEANEKLLANFENVLFPELKLNYNDYSISVTAEQIEFRYSVEEAVKDAYNIGRTDNIIVNNYVLLFTTFMGKEVDIGYSVNEERLKAFVDDVGSKIPGLVVEPGYYIEENKLIIESGKDGIEVRKDELKSDILKSFSSRLLNDEVFKENYSQSITIPTQMAKASPIDMDKIYAEIYREPQDAYFELDPYKIYPDIDGIDLQMSLEEAKQQIIVQNEQYQFDLKITKANKTIKDLGAEAFPYEISAFSTRYDASNTNRSTNLRIAAEKINGTVLMPGEVFSFYIVGIIGPLLIIVFIG